MKKKIQKSSVEAWKKQLQKTLEEELFLPIKPKILFEELGGGNKSHFDKALSALIKEGLAEIKRGQITPRQKSKEIEGTIRLHFRGFGFVKSREAGTQKAVFIPPQLTKGAVSGDSVKVEITGDSEKGPEGRVIEIIKRNRTQLTGTVVNLISRGEALVHVPLLGNASPIRLLTTNKHKLKIGDRITVHIEQWGDGRESTVGSFLSYIGNIMDPSLDLATTVAAYELKPTFSKPAVEEAKRFGNEVRPSDLKGREDLRKIECFTIDPETAKDYDDALSLTKGPKGEYHLIVHIADVSHYVKPNSALDLEARERGNSFYFPGGVIPMLPEILSNELCSLKADVPRLTISVFMTFDKEGELLNYKIKKAVIQSQARLTYRQAKEILDGKKKSPHLATLKLMVELCEKLIEQRVKRGSLQLAVPQLIVKVDKEGNPTTIEIEQYDVTHQLVEEFMLKANEITATHLANQGKPLAYRIHDAPSTENLKDFIFYAKTLGFDLPKDPSSTDLQLFFDQVRASPVGEQVTTAFIRSMKLASYSIDNIGHYGLGLEYYTHFTSPIRRYIDLVIHRLLFEEADASEDYREIALVCSEREQLAAKAENEIIVFKKLRYLLNQVKENPDRLYQAIITQTKPNGIVFNITDILMEGFLPLSKLEDDFYIYDEVRKSLRGRSTGHMLRAGDKLWVIPDSIDLIFLECKWELVEFERTSPAKKPPSRKKQRRSK